MLQAEVGGAGRVDPDGGLQKPGYLIRDFVLTSALGVRVQISDYREQRDADQGRRENRRSTCVVR